jgi:hypothetical protein
MARAWLPETRRRQAALMVMGVRFGSDAIALTHTKPISANKTRVAFIIYHRIDGSSRNEAKAIR